MRISFSTYFGSVPFGTLGRTEDSGAGLEEPRVFFSVPEGNPNPPTGWLTFWKAHNNTVSSAVPKVDWTYEMAIVAAIGLRSEAGDSVEIRRVVSTGGRYPGRSVREDSRRLLLAGGPRSLSGTHHRSSQDAARYDPIQPGEAGTGPLRGVGSCHFDGNTSLSSWPFSLLVSALGGGLAYRSASRALEEELDRKLIAVARAAADVGFSSELLLEFPPGSEDQDFFTSGPGKTGSPQKFRGSGIHHSAGPLRYRHDPARRLHQNRGTRPGVESPCRRDRPGRARGLRHLRPHRAHRRSLLQVRIRSTGAEQRARAREQRRPGRSDVGRLSGPFGGIPADGHSRFGAGGGGGGPHRLVPGHHRDRTHESAGPGGPPHSAGADGRTGSSGAGW